MKDRIIIMLFIFISVPVYIFAEQKITWEPVAGAFGYSLEIKDSKDNIVIDTSVTENSFSVSQLEPGSYSFRISTLNILKQKGESTPWIDFVIEKLYIPELKSISKRELIGSLSNNNIVVTGVNLKPGSRFFLRGNGREIELPDAVINSDNEAVLSFKPDTSLKGVYDFAVVNRGGAESVLKNAIEIVEPERAKLTCFIGGGYGVSIPFGKWSDYYSFSLIGANLFFQVSGRNFELENILFETELDIVIYNNSDSMKKSTLLCSTFGVGSGYYYPVIHNFLDLFFKFHAGGVYTYLDLDESPEDNVASIDIFAMAGAGTRVYLNRDYFLDSMCGVKTIFYKGASLYDVRVSVSYGMKF